jgi:hypothetical protein
MSFRIPPSRSTFGAGNSKAAVEVKYVTYIGTVTPELGARCVDIVHDKE